MKKTKTGLGLKAVSAKLTQSKSKSGKKVVAGTYEEYSKQQKSERESYDTLKYGGKGVTRKFVHGFTVGIVGEKNASSIAERFGNEKEQEESFQNLRGNNAGVGKAPAVSGIADSKIEKTVKAETTKVIDDIDSVDTKIEKIGSSVSRIESTLTAEKQTLDPDAPLTNKNDPMYKELAAYLKKSGGKNVDIEERMKSSWGSTLEERLKNLISGKKYERKTKPTVEKVEPKKTEPTAEKLNKEEVIPAVEQAKEKIDQPVVPRKQKIGKRSRYGYEDDSPKTYADYSKKRKSERQAEDTLKYGGKGVGRKFLYGFTAGIIGEKAASHIAEKHGNKKEQEEAFQILKPKDRGTSSGIGDQAKAEEARKDEDKKEQDDKDKKQKEELKKELDGIKETVEKSSKDGLGKIIGFIGTAISGLMAVVGPALAGLASMLGPVLAVAGAAAAGVAIGTGIKKAGDYLTTKITGEGGMGQALAAHGEKEELAAASKARGEPQSEAEAIKMGKNTWVENPGPSQVNHVVPKEKRVGGAYEGKNIPPQIQSKAKEDTVSQPSAENKELTNNQNQSTTTVVNVPAKQQAPTLIKSGNESGGGIIIIRNVEPSVATYVASIFDHPVVHPGIYKM